MQMISRTQQQNRNNLKKKGILRNVLINNITEKEDEGRNNYKAVILTGNYKTKRLSKECE